MTITFKDIIVYFLIFDVSLVMTTVVDDLLSIPNNVIDSK